jgi:hypothetical protein
MVITKAIHGIVLPFKSKLLAQKQADLELASKEVSQAYFGTHPEVVAGYRNQVGKGPFWERFNEKNTKKRPKQPVQ